MKKILSKLMVPFMILLVINMIGFVFHKNYEGAVIGSVVGVVGVVNIGIGVGVGVGSRVWLGAIANITAINCRSNTKTKSSRCG